MDRNTVIGLLLIGVILIGYSIYVQPGEAELEAMKRQRDSIAEVEKRKEKEAQRTTARELQEEVIGDDKLMANTDTSLQDTLTPSRDSLKLVREKEKFGIFASAAEGEKKYAIIENELLRVKISTQGGQPVEAELKNYRTYDSLPLLLFHEDSSRFNLNFFVNNRLINTDQLYFDPSKTEVKVREGDEGSVSMKLYGESKDQYIEYLYSLKGEGYLLDLKVNVVGLNELLIKNNRAFELQWYIAALAKEKGIENEQNSTTVYYKYKDDEVDYISERSDEEAVFEATVKWISFKQQFFSAALISEEGFDKTNAVASTKTLEGSTRYTRFLSTNLTIPFDRQEEASNKMSFYLGPNNYQVLKKLDLEMEEQIDLGWGIFGWVNKLMVIPIFNFLDSFHLNYGLIILILTLFIKMILFPITYKNYKSSARMRVLKPEIEELNKKYEGAEAMKKQQAMMALYKKAGVNPMAGCLPMLLQLPILYALFRFFPSSIELRQESFLWAEDLSTYDSILSLPFSIPFYGDHVSGFTLLMAISTFFYSRTNTQMAMTSGPQAQQMKIMTNFMPIMLLFFFNGFSAGLSYYYFLANVISIAQQWVIKKWFINEDKIHRQIQEHKKKPVKKSKFQKRLEDMAKKRGYQPPKK